MATRYARAGLVLAAVLVGFGYGLAVGYYKVFPFRQLLSFRHTLTDDVACADCGPNTRWADRVAQFRAFPAQATNVFLGDSITHFAHWEEIFQNHSVLNRGVGSDKVTDVLARLDTVLSAAPRRVLIMMGVNDFNLARRPVDDVFDTYIKVVEALTARNIDVVVQSTIECADCKDATAKIRRLNLMLKAYCDANGLVFLDLNTALADSNGLRQEYQRDGVHPNIAGYRVWAGLVAPLLL